MSLEPDSLLAPLPADRAIVVRVARIPAGFTAAAATAGIKASGRPDLALVVAEDGPVAAAAVFTPNRLAAAPVVLSKANLQATGGTGRPRATPAPWSSTSGSANAATGPAGDADQAEIGVAVATALGAVPAHVLHLSTGVIGTRLPVDKVTAAVASAVAGGLGGNGRCPRGGRGGAADDRLDHQGSQRVRRAPGRRRHPVAITVTGIAKGVGMIHPRMATMLSIVLTDAPPRRRPVGPPADRRRHHLGPALGRR